MKAISSAVALITTAWISLSNFPQETASFKAALDGVHAVPPNSIFRENRGGLFSFDTTGRFSGYVSLINYNDVNSVTLFRSSDVSQIGTRLFDFTPGPIELPARQEGVAARTSTLIGY